MNTELVNKDFSKIESLLLALANNINTMPSCVVLDKVRNIQLVCMNCKALNITTITDEISARIYSILDELSMYITNILLLEKDVTYEDIISLYKISKKYNLIK